MLLYHAGFQEIRKPDVHYGRRNADFGQGFYLTVEKDFAERWARERKGFDSVLNTYQLNLDGLKVKRFERSTEWFGYINANRNGAPDMLAEFDVIIGPIANDTIYNTLGILSSGYLAPEQALRLLQIGPEYTQLVIKTETAADRLGWLSARILSRDELETYRQTVLHEEEDYLRAFGEAMETVLNDDG